ncbi:MULTISPECIES: hypothetical protein [unclassified Clostridium]|uniref:hypothetical protein n=1 Tax=unclassified Clostridium TaxID=2614128 RepID=UPI000297BE8E|nr:MULTISPECIES: hypothetical protein [unclassified Clostridium]EKQ57053.1 MAG: hypothetical protein A370_01361 [Clostridium sp. Maddingley MBC34-26]
MSKTKINNEKNTSINVNKTIEKTAKETAKAIIEELKVQNMIRRELSYYKRVELLLYNYENLKDAVKQKDEDIQHIEKHGLPQSSGSIVVYQTAGGGISPEDRYLQLIEKYKAEKIETQRDLTRIENALDKIRDDKYFDIIQLKYLNLQKDKLETDEKIAERLEKDQSTVTRNRKRLMNKLITILFPESIRDVM